MMHDAYYFSIATLPTPAKTVIAERLRTANVPETVKEEFNRVADFMLKGNSLEDGHLLKMNLRDLDFKRQQNLAQVEPEFAQLIDYDFART
jgi:hypothetical protein